MNEVPGPRANNIDQLRNIQHDLDWIKDKLRAVELRSTPNVRVTQTPDGTILEVDATATAQDTAVKSVWRP